MNNSEFSTEFDVLYNNITSNQAPGLNEYEKSVFLTKAQSQLINEYFNIRTDGVGGGFDGSQRRQYDFSSLINIASPVNITRATTTIDRRGIVYAFPKDFFLSVNEILSDGKYQYSILPINYAEYQRLMLKPYNFPVKRGAWRLLKGQEAYNEYNEEGYKFSCPVFNSKPTKLIIKAQQGSVSSTDNLRGNNIITSVGNGNRCNIAPDVVEGSAENTVDLQCTFITLRNLDDDTIIKMVQEAFSRLQSSYNNYEAYESDVVVKAGIYLDWLKEAKAPLNKRNFVDSDKIMKSNIVMGVTAAEIIGKFNGTPSYQLRYIKRPKPIILEDLTNYGNYLTIDGEDAISNCELPEETHPEILERAVTLAKIAWQGGTMTQAQQQAQQQDRR